MKRISFTLILLNLLMILSAANLELAPYNGASGLNIANPNYKNEGTIWKDPANGAPIADGYNNTEMLGVGGIYNINTLNNKTDLEEPIIVTVTCPYGFYLVSQSNPNYKRPFRIVMGQGQKRNDTNNYEYEADIIFEEGRPQQQDVNLRTEEDAAAVFSMNTLLSGDYQVGFWFNIVLDLPGEIDPVTNVLTYNNYSYPLVEADDYTALVTITLLWKGEERSVTIPFSGYYNGVPSDYDANEGLASLYVDPYASAAHLSIERDRGTWVPVAKLDFLLQQSTGYKNPLIFLSSSSNPADPSPGEFKLVHQNVTYDTPLTNTNSIGFEGRIRTIKGSSTPVRSFDGTMNIINVDANNSINPSEDKAYESGNTMGHGATQTFYTYSGEIDVMLDAGSNVMIDGIYTGTMYVHVVAEVGAS